MPESEKLAFSETQGQATYLGFVPHPGGNIIANLIAVEFDWPSAVPLGGAAGFQSPLGDVT